MVDQLSREHQYEYNTNANLVVQNDRTHSSVNDPSGEATSIKETIQNFGDKAQREKPVTTQLKKRNAEEANLTSLPSHLIGKEAQSYWPKTKETQQIYQQFLDTIKIYLPDQSEDTLRGGAEEMLSILHADIPVSNKKSEIESLIDSITNETLNKLLMLSKQLVDFGISAQNVDEEEKIDVALEIDEMPLEEDKQENDLNIQEIEDDANIPTEPTYANKMNERQTEKSSESEINEGWLKSELVKELGNIPNIIELESKILEILSIENPVECENKLVMLFKYQNQNLTAKLIKNKAKIYCISLISKATNQEERNAIIQQIKSTSEGKKIIDELNNSAKGGEEITRFLDLEAITFTQGSHLLTNKKCILPKNYKRESKKGYEEIYIPSLKPNIPEGERPIKVTELPEWMQKAFPMKEFNRIQSKVCPCALSSDENMLICAPTGAGKTYIALMTILRVITKYRTETGDISLSNFKVIYVAPMKALVSELVGNFSQRLSHLKIQVKEFTGDVHLTKQQIDSTQVIITTPEKWDIVTRKSGERAFLNLVKLVIIDEIHLLHDMRGPVLEAIVARLVRQVVTTKDPIRIVAMSATLPNYKNVANFLRVEKGLFFFDNSYRAVPLEQIYIGVTEKKAIKRMILINEILYDKVMQRAGKTQMLVFVHSRRETSKTAKAIRDMALAKDELNKFLKENSASREVLQTVCNEAINSDIKSLLPFGIAIHHAGLSRKDRSLVEDLFADGHIQILVSTSTLAWGVNLPAHTVIIKGTQIYSPEQGKWIELSPQDILQMTGRAGRFGMHSQGEGILITTHSELLYYLSLNNMQMPIESQLISQIVDHLNAEIVLGTVTDIKEGAEWLKYTYLYQRIITSPEIYKIDSDEMKKDPTLLKYRMDLIHSAALVLDKYNIIKYDPKIGIFQSTMLGTISSHYYIKTDSMAVYSQNLKPNMGMIDLFRLFSLSKEFQYIPIREEEKIELQKLYSTVPVPVKGSLEESTSKVIILLEAYISRFKMDGYALNADMVYVTQSASRIFRCFFEICTKRNWANAAENCLRLCKMVEKKMWTVCSPLRQFKGISEDIIRKLENKEQFTWEHYYDMNAQQLGELVKAGKIGKTLYTLIHKFPKLNLSAYVQPITFSTIRIELTITPDFTWDETLHGNAEPFWIFVEDVDGEMLLHHEQFTLKQSSATEQIISFIVSIYEPLPPQYFIKVISDRWLGSETLLPISFKHLCRPAKFPVSTEVHDIAKVPVSILGWQLAEQMFNFAEFNSLQSQVFESIYNGDESIFIGSPTGSGKTVCALLSILRVIGKGDIGKWVYLVPSQSVAEQKYNEWKTQLERLGVSVYILSGQTIIDLKMIESARLLVTTPKNWDIISRRWKQRKAIQAVSLFVIDEVHMIGMDTATMEVCISRMRYIASSIGKIIRFVALGASIANYNDIVDWIGCTKSFNFLPSSRPAPLESAVIGYDQLNIEARLYAMSRPAFNWAKKFADGQRMLFTPDRKTARRMAMDMINHAFAENTPNIFLPKKVVDIEGKVSLLSDKMIQHTLQFGVGILFDGMREAEKKLIKELYNTKQISFLICSFDVCWELDNMLCQACIVIDAERYDGHEQRYVEYKVPEVLQMMGRVEYSKQGAFVLFCHGPKKEYFEKFINTPYPVESALVNCFHDYINAEINSETITNKQDAVDWITWTYMYRRLLLNPNYYNMQNNTPETMNTYISELVDSTLDQLKTSNCIEITDEVSVKSANLGRIASYYYISYSTIDMFAQSLNVPRKLATLLEILCSASEYDSLPIRYGDEEMLRTYLKYISHPLPQNSQISDPHIKANILLQLYLSRITLPFDFKTDQKLVLEDAIRLLQAMVDVISSFGHLSTALIAMEFCQMIVQAQWISESSLLQLPYFDEATAKKFSEINVKDIIDFVNMEEKQRTKILQLDDKKMEEIAVVCNRYPSIDMKYTILSETPIPKDGFIELEIDLRREIEGNVLPPINAPYYGKEKEESWWIVIGESSASTLYAIKKQIIGKSVKANLKAKLPLAGRVKLKLYLICDSYIGCDQELDLEVVVKDN